MPLTRAEKIARLSASVRRFANESDVESLARSRPPGEESFESFDVNTAAATGLKKLLAGRGDQLTDEELLAQEAIVKAPRGQTRKMVIFC